MPIGRLAGDREIEVIGAPHAAPGTDVAEDLLTIGDRDVGIALGDHPRHVLGRQGAEVPHAYRKLDLLGWIRLTVAVPGARAAVVVVDRMLRVADEAVFLHDLQAAQVGGVVVLGDGDQHLADRLRADRQLGDAVRAGVAADVRLLSLPEADIGARAGEAAGGDQHGDRVRAERHLGRMVDRHVLGHAGPLLARRITHDVVPVDEVRGLGVVPVRVVGVDF